MQGRAVVPQRVWEWRGIDRLAFEKALAFSNRDFVIHFEYPT